MRGDDGAQRVEVLCFPGDGEGAEQESYKKEVPGGSGMSPGGVRDWRGVMKEE